MEAKALSFPFKAEQMSLWNLKLQPIKKKWMQKVDAENLPRS